MKMNLVVALAIIMICVQTHAHKHEITAPVLVYQWIALEFKWPNDTFKQEYIDKGLYKPEHNSLNGIKLYNETVYLTIPRLKPGVPATLVRVTENGGQSPILEPFPSWDMHIKGDCNTLQLIQSMEIDPNTGFMWILDTAYVPTQKIEVADRCPAKLVIYDLIENKEVHRHEFAKSVVGTGLFYLNDIVLDYGYDKTARFAYISDTLGWRLIVYDRKMDTSWSFSHASMMPNSMYENVTISNSSTNIKVLGINGIAISSDFQFVYYSAVAGVGLYQIPTSILRDKSADNAIFAKHVRHVGDKISQSDGMYYGKKNNLYFSTLGENAVYKWPVETDITSKGSASDVKLSTQVKVSGDSRMEWIDSLGMDQEGYLWIATNNLHTFFDDGNKTGKWNYFVWKAFVDDSSYLNITGLEIVRVTQGAQGVKFSFCYLVFCFFVTLGLLK